jgi:hypothetical protein
MESRKRRIREGVEFDHLFPSPSEDDVTVKKQADVEDTMALIQRTVPKTLWQTKKIAQKLRGRTLEETCSNIWHFVYDHIQYKRDKDGVEQVRSPRRTWWERESGVDCDCYTEFISSILLNFNIPHKARITKYPKRPPEIPRWQHVYPIVPKNGKLNGKLNGHLERYDYIVLDCVKDEYDDEQPFLESKDYDMRLDYLDGIQEEVIEEDVNQLMNTEYTEPDNVDLADLASIYDDEEMGNIFKKIGSGIKKVAKKVGDKVGDGVRFINRFANPATILLRNGFLLAMKVNLLNVGGRLRFAYLTDAQAKEKGVNMDSLKKLRTVKDRAETVYWQAGGKKENLKKAILKGKGNKDKKVPLSGLDGLDEVYADLDEYNIIHNDINDLGELGDPATGAALAAATSAVAAIAGALKQVKGLFNKGGKEEQSFQSETDNAGGATSSPAITSEDEEKILMDDEVTSQTQYNEKQLPTSTFTNPASTSQPALPASNSVSRRGATDVSKAQESNAVQNQEGRPEGFLHKTTTWVKQNPGKSLLIAGAAVAGSYMLVKAMQGSKSTNGLSGLPRKQKKRKKKRSKAKSIKNKVERTNLL